MFTDLSFLNLLSPRLKLCCWYLLLLFSWRCRRAVPDATRRVALNRRTYSMAFLQSAPVVVKVGTASRTAYDDSKTRPHTPVRLSKPLIANEWCFLIPESRLKGNQFVATGEAGQAGPPTLRSATTRLPFHILDQSSNVFVADILPFHSVCFTDNAAGCAPSSVSRPLMH